MPCRKKSKIPPQVLWGSLDGFNKPGEIVFTTLVQNTDAYKAIKKREIKRGTGEYWILLDKANSRAIRAVRDFGKGSDYDLLVQAGYFAAIDPAIPAVNVTQDVLDSLEEEE